jgi:hypothetical protein
MQIKIEKTVTNRAELQGDPASPSDWLCGPVSDSHLKGFSALWLRKSGKEKKKQGVVAHRSINPRHKDQEFEASLHIIELSLKIK